MDNPSPLRKKSLQEFSEVSFHLDLYTNDLKKFFLKNIYLFGCTGS